METKTFVRLQDHKRVCKVLTVLPVDDYWFSVLLLGNRGCSFMLRRLRWFGNLPDVC